MPRSRTPVMVVLQLRAVRIFISFAFSPLPTVHRDVHMHSRPYAHNFTQTVRILARSTRQELPHQTRQILSPSPSILSSSRLRFKTPSPGAQPSLQRSRAPAPASPSPTPTSPPLAKRGARTAHPTPS
ncbi:hypothetical protein DENSPDRAFT_241713 [Dentipellis sp. KUC8613]|nr:hypothetical protein DENSPDRAFT_241713 [Dentipellis sp. KUC8613]